MQCWSQSRCLAVLAWFQAVLAWYQTLTGAECGAQVISITVLGSQNGTGGFFPNGLLGPINGTAASIGAVDTVPTLPPSPGSTPAIAPSPAPAPSPSSAIAAATSATVNSCCAASSLDSPGACRRARLCSLLCLHLHFMTHDTARYLSRTY